MKFGPVPIDEAPGGVAAHSVRVAGGVLRKGSRIVAEDVARLREAGLTEVVVARLETGDLDENEAARRLAEVLAGAGIFVEAPFTGRVNLFAEHAGVLTIAAETVDALNRIDEAITVATLPASKAVVAGEMVATIKIIPYGVAQAHVSQALEAVAGRAPIAVAAYRPLRVAVISTLLPGLKPSVVEKTLKVLDERLVPAGARRVLDLRVPHEPEALGGALREASATGAELTVVFGASAITDRRDVVPLALELAGGRVDHLGMPVDPGNLLMLGELDGRTVLGAPGCARSPRENGFDWVLQRRLAGIAVRRVDIQAMGVGGLLMEIVSRPQPRAPGRADLPVAGIVLAAGRSSRMGARNKLTETVRDEPMVRHAVQAQIAAKLEPIVVVTGHEREAVEAALAGLGVTFVHNPDYGHGLAGSLRAGLAAVPEEARGVVVSLGDMPDVTGPIIARLTQVFADREDAVAVAPTLLGERGNPVLLARAVFADVAQLSGDEGARRLLARAGEQVVEVAIDDPAIMLDIDTPQALAVHRRED